MSKDTAFRYDLSDLRFGRLVVLRRSHRDPTPSQGVIFWDCKCDCGTLVTVASTSLRRKKKPTISCGCYRYDRVTGKPAPNRLDYARSNLRSLLHSYKKSARNRGLEFSLSEDQFGLLTLKNCYYCNAKPSQVHSKRETYGKYIYNGIDRLDNSMGYLYFNCVPCCKICNYAKRAMSLEEFCEWIKKVYNKMISNPIDLSVIS